MLSARTGLPITSGSLGTLSSVVAVDRGASGVGPVPTDIGGGYFSIDLSPYSGFAINVVVSSTDGGIHPYTYADAIAAPLPIDNLTDFADARNGRRCARTGLWVPASRLKYVKGVPFLDTVAPDVWNEPVPNPPGILTPSSSTGNTPTTGPYIS